MIVLPTLIKGIKEISVKTQGGCFTDTVKLFIILIWKKKATRRAKTILKKKNEVAGLQFKNYYKVYVNQDSELLAKGRTLTSMEQKKDSTSRLTHRWELILTKVQRQFKRNDNLFKKWCWIPIQKIFTLTHTSYSLQNLTQSGPLTYRLNANLQNS